MVLLALAVTLCLLLVLPMVRKQKVAQHASLQDLALPAATCA